MTGLGLILGPLIGGLLYSAVGFSSVFYILGVIVIVMSFVFKYCYPDEKDE